MAEVGISRSDDGLVAVVVHLSPSDLSGIGFSADQPEPTAQTPAAPAIDHTTTGTTGEATFTEGESTVGGQGNEQNAGTSSTGQGTQPEPEQPGDSPHGSAPPPEPPPAEPPAGF